MTKPVEIKCRAAAGAHLPEYKTEGAAGADVCALSEHPVTIESGCTEIIHTGLSFEIPQGYEIQVRPRSGLAAKNSVTVLNTPGTIDSDYRGELMVILINLGKKPFVVNSGDRIAQIIVAPVTRGSFTASDELGETARGTGGFGSTGVRA
jgi:dUTP pyrophosphatase